ncbi:LysM peptidoglycan-binding domain-containing protein [Neobacillus ginsengisoli]|uniref:LysM repeat protein n=1 Tax=Neobacillus ginsengisoli TaxID=904295 RepID=A0ABT9XPJ5_9BACI|nr:LysM peptidoglycan-binding domain-containing protein [Neobacillus ginsengisoli]MDQ0197464.1 LysM repeat protein [Neobacillus ginsengisoli]
MNKEEPYRDQAERLRQRIEKINEKTEDGKRLPPRGQLHRQKQPKIKWKLKYPIIRLLVLIFILLPIISFSVISYLHEKKIGGAEKVSGDANNAGYETINLEKNNSEKVNSTNNPIKKKDTSQSDGENSSTDGSLESTTQTQPATGEKASILPTDANVIDRPIGPDSDKNSSPGPNTNLSKTNNSPVTKKIVYHTVQPHETLYHIAIVYYHSQTGMDIIKNANHLKSDKLEQGQVLKIPLDN